MAELNLLPYELRKELEKKKKQKKYVVQAAAILIMLFFGASIPRAYLAVLRIRDDKLSAQIAGNKKVLEDNVAMKNEIAKYKDYNAKVEMLTKQKVPVTDKIKNIQKYMPKDVVLNNLSYGNGKFVLNGKTSNYSSISVFAANLQMSEEYRKAKIATIDNKDDKNSSAVSYEFSINIEE